MSAPSTRVQEQELKTLRGGRTTSGMTCGLLNTSSELTFTQGENKNGKVLNA